MDPSKKNRRRVAIVGIDGFSPLWIDRFLDQGELPAIRRVRDSGLHVRLVSTLPATTPVAWAAISTGCLPARNGIEGFLLHRPGQRLDQRISGTYSTRCRAEPIWETASLWGKRSLVVKFPVSYPSTSAALRIDGAAGWGGIKCLHEAGSASVTDSTEPVGISGLAPDSESWAGSPGDLGRPVWYGRLLLATLWGGPSIDLPVAVLVNPSAAPLVAVSSQRDWDTALVLAEPGAWTPPLTIPVVGRRGKTPCSFRLKVLTCTVDPPGLRLFNTCVHEQEGHSEPAQTWRRYLHEVGPIEEQTDPELFFAGRIDLATQFERFRLNVDWLKRVTTALLSRETWDLFMIQLHFVDWAHHILHGSVDPRHPLYDSAEAGRYEQLLLDAYRMADELVATVTAAAGSDSNVVVLGDHGQDLHHTTLRLNEWLAQQDWLVWADGNTVDWTRTQLYAAGNYVYVNALGRDPDGIVPADEVPRLADETVRRLLALTDPRTGERPVLIAGPKRHFEWLGADGEGVGDIVLCLASGYQARNDRGPVFALTVPLKEFTSGHDHFWPLDPRIQTTLFAAGPSFRMGYSLPGAAHVIDVAPTLCAVLGINPSPDCQGRILTDLLRQAESVDSLAEPFDEIEVEKLL